MHSIFSKTIINCSKLSDDYCWKFANKLTNKRPADVEPASVSGAAASIFLPGAWFGAICDQHRVGTTNISPKSRDLRPAASNSGIYLDQYVFIFHLHDFDGVSLLFSWRNKTIVLGVEVRVKCAALSTVQLYLL